MGFDSRTDEGGNLAVTRGDKSGTRKGDAMTEQTRYMLDDLLSQWHQWAKGFKIVGKHGTAPMFNNLVSSHQWDTENDVTDGYLHHSQMETVDFHISELVPIHRTAIGINARNLVTGYSVWTSARLPTDLEQRVVILRDARNILQKRLTDAGIL